MPKKRKCVRTCNVRVLDNKTHKVRSCKNCAQTNRPTCYVHEKYPPYIEPSQFAPSEIKDEKQEEERVNIELKRDLKHRSTLDALSPPAVSHDFYSKKVQEWIRELESPTLRSAYREFFRVSRYISWDRFILEFKKCIRNFLKAIGKEPFALILPLQVDGHPVKTKSNYWLTILAYVLFKEEFHRPPNVFATTNRVLQQHIKHLVLVDDAIYSGTQMSDILMTVRRAERNQAYEQHDFALLAPFCTVAATKKIKHVFRDNPFRFTIYCASTMKPLEELLNDDVLDTLEAFRRLDTMLFPYVFQHKLPDDVSSFPEIYSEVMQNCDTEDMRCFEPHYKQVDYWDSK